MSDFSVNDLVEWTENYENDFHWGNLNNNWKTYDSPWGQIVWVKTDSEYDEGSQSLIMIFRIGDRYFQKTGYYDSWDGGAWDGFLTEVYPHEKVVTVYLPI